MFAITVDDCYVDTLPDMCDICETKQWPVTFYPAVDFIDGRVLVYFILRKLKKYTKGHSIAIDGTTYNFADETVWQSFFKDLNYKMYTMQEKKYLVIADRAYQYLVGRLLDKQYGGYYWAVNNDGSILEDKKQVYGIAFWLYGLAEYYKATNKEEVLQQAKNCYTWIEQYGLTILYCLRARRYHLLIYSG